MPVRLPFEFDIRRSAFVIVDMQNDFVRRNAPLGVPDAIDTVEAINRTQALFRDHHRPVIFTRFVAGRQPSLLWTWSPEIHEPTNCCKLGHRRFYDELGEEQECTRIIDELEPREEDIYIDKYWYGAFFRTNIDDVLRSYGADSIVVAGTVTQICVEDTVRQAFHNGYKVITLSDGVSSFDPQLHDATLKNISMKFGAVITSEELRSVVEAALAGQK